MIVVNSSIWIRLATAKTPLICASLPYSERSEVSNEILRYTAFRSV
jgi:hypothetical protein